jgi:hypothetical protein
MVATLMRKSGEIICRTMDFLCDMVRLVNAAAFAGVAEIPLMHVAYRGPEQPVAAAAADRDTLAPCEPHFDSLLTNSRRPPLGNGITFACRTGAGGKSAVAHAAQMTSQKSNMDFNDRYRPS